MKKNHIVFVCSLFVCLLAGPSAFAQLPVSVPYQAVVRDSAGNLVTNRNITVEFSIIDYNLSYGYPPFCTEIHYVTTNEFGLFTANIGEGIPTTLDWFIDIDWSTGYKELDVSIDINGGTDFTFIGATQINAVPYALYAARSGGGIGDGHNNGNTLHWAGSKWENDSNLYNNGSYIGIGTQSPHAKLEIHENSESVTAVMTNAITGTGSFDGFKIGINGTSPYLMNMEESTLTLGTNGLDRMHIEANGNVGIGVTNPATKLVVGGRTTTNDFSMINGANDGYVMECDPDGNAFWADPLSLIASINCTDSNIVPKWNGSALVDGSIYDDGNVGIGTTSPEFKLTLENDGGILAKGQLGSGADLTTVGGGTRLIWYPKKAAFRAGYVSGSEWNDSNIGERSFAGGSTVRASGEGAAGFGLFNIADGEFSFIAGRNNVASGSGSVALGRYSNASGISSFAFGETASAAGNYSSAIGNGTSASGSSSHASGYSSIASAPSSTAMGFQTEANGYNSTAMGQLSVAHGTAATAMGHSTQANGDESTAAGLNCIAGGDHSVAMGSSADASGTTAISLGAATSASGTHSVAIGQNATANASNAVAIGDHVTASEINSTALGNYVSTDGGSGSFVIGDKSTTTILTPSGDGTLANTFTARFNHGYTLYTTYDIGSANTSYVYMQHGDGSWSGTSDRRKKEEFQPIDLENLLQKVGLFEITTWNYKSQDHSHRHIGCMAQDFYNAFHLNGEGNDTTINSLDIDGVNMAAIQALKIRTDELKKATDKIDVLQSEIDEMKSQIAAIVKNNTGAISPKN